MNAITKTGQKILNALAFANVGNQGEFQALLAQMDEQPGSASGQAKPRLVSVSSDRPAMAPSITHIRQAL